MADEKILSLFRETDDYLSGEELSRKLGITRAAVWKHIEKLRAEGYNIVAQPHSGYKLLGLPDKLIPSEIAWKLSTSIIGRKIYSYDKANSTMDIAIDLASRGEPEGACIFAEEQAAGRGRLGRSWASPKGKGIYLSIILRPNITPLEAPKVTLLCAVAAAKAVREETSLPALIKWPNDILINGRKVAGILTEMNAEVDTVKFIIIGIGININALKSELPQGATSIKEELGDGLSRVEFTQAFLRRLDKDYEVFLKEGFKPTITEWRDLSFTLGSRVKVKLPNKELEGQAMDVDDTGALVVRLDSGFVERILAGDVIVVR